jgi:hypothetical protein
VCCQPACNGVFSHVLLYSSFVQATAIATAVQSLRELGSVRVAPLSSSMALCYGVRGVGSRVQLAGLQRCILVPLSLTHSHVSVAYLGW